VKYSISFLTRDPIVPLVPIATGAGALIIIILFGILVLMADSGNGTDFIASFELGP
jgi:hypothetical protein